MKFYYFILLCSISSLQSMQTAVQLKDGTIFSFSCEEIDASAVLLQKQLLRTKTTAAHVKQWGYTDTEYEQFKKAPLYLTTVNEEGCNLFTKFLHLNKDFWKQEFNNLDTSQKNTLLYIASEQGLGVPQFIVQLNEIILLPDIVNEHIAFHFSPQDMISYLRTTCITDNAYNKGCTQSTETFDLDSCTMICNDTLNCPMIIPDKMLENDCALFSGHIREFCSGHILNGAQWLCDRKKWRINNSPDKPPVCYLITPPLPHEALQAINDIPMDKRLLWTLDQNNNIVNSTMLNFDGQFINTLFSPNGHYLASKIKKTDKHYSLIFVTLGTKPDGSDSFSTQLPEANTELRGYRAYCFNDQSTLLAASKRADSTIVLWDTTANNQYSAFSHPYIASSSLTCTSLRFNHKGNKLIAIYRWNNYGYSNSEIVLWDTSNGDNIQHINGFFIQSDFFFHPHFNSKDTVIVLTALNEELLFLDGKTGKIIFYSGKDEQIELLTDVASTFNHDDTLLVAATLPSDDNETGNVLLLNGTTGAIISTLLSEQDNICGVGFTPDKRHVITTCKDGKKNNMIITSLYDEQTHNALSWLENGTSFLQKYALYCTYQAWQERDTEVPWKMPRLFNYVFPSEDAGDARRIIQNYLR